MAPDDLVQGEILPPVKRGAGKEHTRGGAEKPAGRGPGRPKGPFETDKANYRVPPGVMPLVDQIGAIIRRWNGPGCSDGLVVAEAVLALGEKMAEHPKATEAECSVIRERIQVLRRHLDTFYQTTSPEGSIRP